MQIGRHASLGATALAAQKTTPKLVALALS